MAGGRDGSGSAEANSFFLHSFFLYIFHFLLKAVLHCSFLEPLQDNRHPAPPGSHRAPLTVVVELNPVAQGGGWCLRPLQAVQAEPAAAPVPLPSWEPGVSGWSTDAARLGGGGLGAHTHLCPCTECGCPVSAALSRRSATVRPRAHLGDGMVGALGCLCPPPNVPVLAPTAAHSGTH